MRAVVLELRQHIHLSRCRAKKELAVRERQQDREQQVEYDRMLSERAAANAAALAAIRSRSAARCAGVGDWVSNRAFENICIQFPFVFVVKVSEMWSGWVWWWVICHQPRLVKPTAPDWACVMEHVVIWDQSRLEVGMVAA